jgi:glycosyltransferase involved in cell wall biosynthesis
MVRNAASTVRVCLLNQLSHGLDRILILDNGSTDATPTILRRLERRMPISVVRDEGPFRQDELMTGLLHEAADLGADWVVPFDDDEFLVSDVPFRAQLEMVQQDGMLIRLVNFVQRRSRRRDSPRALLTMVTRPESTVDARRAAELGRQGRIAIVEVEKHRKLILRASRDVRLDLGNHGAQGIGGVELADWCRFLHAPIRAPGVLRHSAEHGRRLRGLRSPDEGWQHQLMADEEAAGRLAEQWRMNSWDGELVLGRGGARLVRDDALADAVRPWVRSPLAQLAARAARRPY